MCGTVVTGQQNARCASGIAGSLCSQSQSENLIIAELRPTGPALAAFIPLVSILIPAYVIISPYEDISSNQLRYRTEHRAIDLLLAAAEAVAMFTLAYPACTSTGTVLLQTAPRRGLTHGRTEGFLRLPRHALVELSQEIDMEGRVVGGDELEFVGGLGGTRFGDDSCLTARKESISSVLTQMLESEADDEDGMEMN